MLVFSPLCLGIPELVQFKMLPFLLPVADFEAFSSLFRGDKCFVIMAAPQGFEPRYADPESAVLPLNEGATSAKLAILQPR